MYSKAARKLPAVGDFPLLPGHLAQAKIQSYKNKQEVPKATKWDKVDLEDDNQTLEIANKWWDDSPSWRRWLAAINDWMLKGLEGKVTMYWALRNHEKQYLGPGPKYMTTLEFCELFEVVAFKHFLPRAMKMQDKERIVYIQGRNRVFCLDAIDKLDNARHNSLSVLFAVDMEIPLKDARKKVDDTLYILESKGWIIRKHDRNGPFFILSEHVQETVRGTWFYRKPLIVNYYRVGKDGPS